MQVPSPCPSTVADYTPIILAIVSMLGNVILGYLSAKQRGTIATLKSRPDQ